MSEVAYGADGSPVRYTDAPAARPYTVSVVPIGTISNTDPCRRVTPGNLAAGATMTEGFGGVGMTGLATGPHVCFRFWKNGRQVNHLRENLPPPEPMSEEELPKFYVVKDSVIQNLNAIDISVIAKDESPVKMVSSEVTADGD